MALTLRFSIVALLAIFLVPCLTGMVCGQATFTYGFQGADTLQGNATDTESSEYFCTLTQAGVAPPTDPANPVTTGFGVQAWTIVMSAANASITSITTSGTDARKNSEGGLYRAAMDFEQTELTTKSKVGSECEGRNGALSGIALALTLPNALPDNRTYTVAKIGVSATIPTGGGTATLKYVSFMKVEKTSYLKIRFDLLYSIYVIFAVAVIVRYLWILSQLLRGKEPEDADSTAVSSGL